MNNKLTVSDIIKDGIQIGLKNFLSIVGAVILWMLTIWIPYINVGTTIAIWTLPIAMSKGKTISPTEIFDPKYRHHMGGFFITIGLMQMAIVPAMLFMIVPGIVLSIAWSLAVFLVIDKGLNPSAAISKSNELTHGYKWKIFGGLFVIMIAMYILIFLFTWIFPILALIPMLLFFPILLGATSVIYGKLTENYDNTETKNSSADIM